MNYPVFVEVIRIVVPLLAVLWLVYMMLKRFEEREDRRLLMELQKAVKNQTIPLRLQAYERLVLLTERIDPVALFTRLSKDAKNAGEIRFLMLMALQQEFEHNLAQQTYVSEPVWIQLVRAKDEVLGLIDRVGSSVGKEVPVSEFGKVLFEVSEQTPTKDLVIARRALKEEAAKLM